MAVTAADLQRYNAATAHLEPPFAVVDLAAMRANAQAMTQRAAGKPSGWPNAEPVTTSSSPTPRPTRPRWPGWPATRRPPPPSP